MRDNFELIREKLKFGNGYFYFIQLLRRAKDEKIGPNGEPNPLYHGNMHSRSLRNYYIRDMKTLDLYENEIKSICDTQDCRAYIRLNRRSDEKVTKILASRLMEYLVSGNYGKPEKALASAIGLACAEPRKSKTWILDVDEEYMRPDITATIWTFLNKELGNILVKDVFVVPTPHGCHFITPPLNKNKYAENWKTLASDPKRQSLFPVPADPPGIQPDNPTILYAP